MARGGRVALVAGRIGSVGNIHRACDRARLTDSLTRFIVNLVKQCQALQTRPPLRSLGSTRLMGRGSEYLE